MKDQQDMKITETLEDRCMLY